MPAVSSVARKISWKDRREVANLLGVLATEQSKVAERLARLREAHALTQEAAAAKAGVTLRQWQRWESGESEPYARNVAKISDVFNIPLDELVRSNGHIEPSQLDRIEHTLETLSKRVEQLEQPTPSEPLKPQTAEQVLDEIKTATRALEQLLGRIGENVGRRELQSRRAKDRSQARPSAAA